MDKSNRRTFLKSSSAVIALPVLETFGPLPESRASSPIRPSAKRLVFLSMGWGVTKGSWFPDKSQVGTDYVMPESLKPLTGFKKDITIIQNLQHQFSTDAHSGSTFWLTGANRYGVPGQSFHNSISVDQVAAEQLGKETRFTSLQMNGKKAAGHGPGSSLAWNRQGKPVPGFDTPVEVFHRLFSDDKTPLALRQAMLRKQHSVLDSVLENAKDIQKGLARNDIDKLDEYFQSIREIEMRLAKEEEWLTVPKRQPSQELPRPDKSLQGYDEIKMNYDLMIAAMQVDATRVFSYRMPTDTLIQSLGAGISSHNMSHYNGTGRHVSLQRDQAHAELLAYFIERLKLFKDSNGIPLYDSTTVVFGSNISVVHNLNNCPTLITGGGAGINHGRHLVMSDTKTPLCNLWLSLLNGIGVNVDAHGDSTGRIDELFV
ncbi:MAG: DUF1552 domain-containing protein [Planctomycetota bacterium]